MGEEIYYPSVLKLNIGYIVDDIWKKYNLKLGFTFNQFLKATGGKKFEGNSEKFEGWFREVRDKRYRYEVDSRIVKRSDKYSILAPYIIPDFNPNIFANMDNRIYFEYAIQIPVSEIMDLFKESLKPIYVVERLYENTKGILKTDIHKWVYQIINVSYSNIIVQGQAPKTNETLIKQLAHNVLSLEKYSSLRDILQAFDCDAVVNEDPVCGEEDVVLFSHEGKITFHIFSDGKSTTEKDCWRVIMGLFLNNFSENSSTEKEMITFSNEITKVFV